MGLIADASACSRNVAAFQDSLHHESAVTTENDIRDRFAVYWLVYAWVALRHATVLIYSWTSQSA